MFVRQNDNNVVGRSVVVPHRNEFLSRPSVLPERFASISRPATLPIVPRELNSQTEPLDLEIANK
jgi:hypothetical protein